MIRIEHRELPPGLSAVARRKAGGDLAITVSDALAPDRQRAAVRCAMRAARRHDWRLGVLPLPAVLVLSALRGRLRRIGHVVRAHAVASAAAGTAVAGVALAGAAFLVSPSHPNGNVAGAGPAAPGYQQSHGANGTTTSPQGSHGRGHSAPGSPSRSTGPGPTTVVVNSPSVSPRPMPNPSPSSTGTGAPAPAPSASSSSAPGSPPPTSSPPGNPSPTATPSSSAPSPSPSRSSPVCIDLLGIVVCL